MIENEDQVFFVLSSKPSPFIADDRLHLNITRLSKFYLVTKQCGNDYDRILCNLEHAQKLYKESIRDLKESKENFNYGESKTPDLKLLKDILLDWKYKIFTKKYGLTKNQYCYIDAVLEYMKYFRFDIGKIREEKLKVDLLKSENSKSKSLQDYHDKFQLEIYFDENLVEDKYNLLDRYYKSICYLLISDNPIKIYL